MLSSAAYADSCKATSAEKKLAGAAQNSFLKKCETDAKKSCDAQAAEKKLHGAAQDELHQEVRDRRGRHLNI